MTWAATPAWTLTRAMWWATTSCRSRAIRRRSSATRRRASSSRVRSARSARSLIASMNARRLRTASPAAHASPVQASTPTFSWLYQGEDPATMAATVSTRAVSRPTRQVVGRSVREATVNRATTVLITTGAGGSTSTSSAAESTPVAASTPMGRWRRCTRAAAASTISSTPPGAGARTPKVGPWPVLGSAKDAQTMPTSTAAARAPSNARGWPRSQRRPRASPVPRVVTSSNGTACRARGAPIRPRRLRDGRRPCPAPVEDRAGHDGECGRRRPLSRGSARRR